MSSQAVLQIYKKYRGVLCKAVDAIIVFQIISFNISTGGAE